nr:MULTISPECIES: hypothetical protein [Streptomyces]
MSIAASCGAVSVGRPWCGPVAASTARSGPWRCPDTTARVVGQGDAGRSEDAGETVGDVAGGDVVEVDAAAGRGGGHDHGGSLDPVPGHRERAAGDPVAAAHVQALLVEVDEDAPGGQEAGGFGASGSVDGWVIRLVPCARAASSIAVTVAPRLGP